MTGPTREEIERWCQFLRDQQQVLAEAGLPDAAITLDQIFGALATYPLPPEDELPALSVERNEIAQAVEICLNLVDDLEGGKVVEAWTADVDAMARVLRNARRAPTLLRALPPEDGERPTYMEMEDAVRALDGARIDGWIKTTVNRMRATLLRQPPPPPAAGVSKGDVLAAIRRSFGAVADSIAYAELEADIEALPEAAPPAPHASVAEPQSDLWRCGCGWIGTVSEMTQAGVATWCPNCGTIGYKLTRVGVGLAAAPPPESAPAPRVCTCAFEGAYKPVPLPGERLFDSICGGEILPPPAPSAIEAVPEAAPREPASADHCPHCASPAPHLHPAVQRGGEVETCGHPFHFRQEAQLSFAGFRAANLARLPEFRDAKGRLSHAAGLSDDGWRPAEWLMALVGELGEAANMLKKVERGDFTLAERRQEIADELADVATYLDLLAAKCGVDLGAAVVGKFNAVSQRVGSSVRLPEPAAAPPSGVDREAVLQLVRNAAEVGAFAFDGDQAALEDAIRALPEAKA